MTTESGLLGPGAKTEKKKPKKKFEWVVYPHFFFYFYFFCVQRWHTSGSVYMGLVSKEMWY
jgi:hypothetical protein